MGCTQSRIEDEEAVTRCKERKRLMKAAVAARSAFAHHHSAYSIALKNTGAALSDFGPGEVHHDHQSAPQPGDPLLPPPPPLPNYPPQTLLRAVSMPEFVIPKSVPKPADPIQEEDDEEVEENSTPVHELSRRGRSRRGGDRIAEEEEVLPRPPLPPSPPRPPPTNSTPPPPPPPEAARDSTWDYFFSTDHNMPGPSLSQSEEIGVNNEEFSDRGYKRSETIDVDDRRKSDRLKRTENIDVASSSSSATSKVETRIPETVIEPEVVTPGKKVKQAVPSRPVIVETKLGGSVVSNVSLMQILNELDDKFLKAYQSASEVSKLLEANRMHYHSNFADNRGHIDHSARLMRVITWNRSIKGLQTNNDANDDDYDAHESLASVLDKLLAWEKKLYDEVKEGEVMKIEYQRKVATLNRRQNQGKQSEALERAKAAVGHLHTRYIVDMQSMDSTVSEISHLRDNHLYPKLVSLVDGMGRMWETMNAQHKAQMKIVEDLRSIDVSDTPNETSEDHHKRTIQLYGAADDWHQQFSKLVINQRNYITALNGWLKLNLMPLESNIKEKPSSPPRVHRPPIHALLNVWHDGLDRLPNELARSAISSFAAIMDSIRILQEDESTLKMKCEKTNKELARETREFGDWYQKYMERVMHNSDGSMDTGRGDDSNRLVERQNKIDTLKLRLKEEEEEYRKQCRHVREKSLSSLKIHLPELFRAMSDFSFAATGMYRKLVPLTQPLRQTESL